MKLHRLYTLCETPSDGGRNFRRMGGLSIVELMVALTIGLILLSALTRLFVTSRSTYTLEEGLARIQENGRFAVEFLSQDIRMAGFIGCASASATTVSNHLNNPTAYGVNTGPSQYINGHAYTGSGARPSALSDWTPALPGTINGITYFSAGDVEPNTDVVVIRRASETGVVLGNQMPNTSADLKIDSNPGDLAQFDIVMISDCTNADIFQITGPASLSGGTNNMTHNTGVGSPGNATKPFSKSYLTDAQIMKLITRVYYVGRRSNSTSNPPALFRRELDMGETGSIRTEELVEGVETMRLSYGEDSDNNSIPDIYRGADSVTDWSKVKSVRLGLLVATNASVDRELDTRTYALAGSGVGPFNDSKRRRAFNTTVQLRNR